MKSHVAWPSIVVVLGHVAKDAVDVVSECVVVVWEETVDAMDCLLKLEVSIEGVLSDGTFSLFVQSF